MHDLGKAFRTTAMAGILLAAASPAFSSQASQPQSAPGTGNSAPAGESLDQAKIHAHYNDGDFEPVIEMLNAFIRRNKAYSHGDSVFIAKHLAVVYSANPETREKGRYYMHRLLELLPSAKLVDMYVSEEVDRIFDKVREEFVARQKAFGVDTTRISLPERPGTKAAAPAAQPAPAPAKAAAAPKKSGAGKWLAWTLGGTTLVAGAATAYYLTLEDPKDKVYKVP